MDPNGGFSAALRHSPFQRKLVGKVKSRLQDMRYRLLPETSVDLSHNESARLATDALLDGGLQAYNKVLVEDGEVDFLSTKEKDYILENLLDTATGSGNPKDDEDDDDALEASDSNSSQTYLPSVTESSPPELDHGWPVEDWSYYLQGTPTVDVYFQTSGSTNLKDMLREFISKATKVLAIVMDTFSDIEIFCDLLEAMRKRNVSVYILLDHQNVPIFEGMCNDLKINASHLSRMSVRSLTGNTYCAKSGRKFTGQIQEKFIISDCTEVLVGSYSFTWLSWQVHRSMAMLFKASGVKPFDLEFRRLYATSTPVHGLTAEGNSSGLPFHLDTKYSPTPSVPTSSSTSTSEEQPPAALCAADSRQNSIAVLDHQQPASPGGLLISSTTKPTLLTGTYAPVKGFDYQQPTSPGGLLTSTPQPTLQTGTYSPVKGLDHQRDVSPRGLLISTTPPPTLKTGTHSPVKAPPQMPLVGPTVQRLPLKPTTTLPPRLQLLLAQRHSSFSRDHSVSALPWRNIVAGSNSHDLPNALDRGLSGPQRKIDVCRKQWPATTTPYRA
ncbi:hypothetical protein ACEWY4_019800 [Coilia grayii]|uniref:Scaffolding anchor of CK1 domain-containing protein n=1 Tax=Coilia grayii TaxID=363190 RepID=A0ABD1JB24_9TELE